MKYITLFITFFSITLYAGPYCIDNSKHLTESYDTKEWHYVTCYCNCETIKSSRCLECGHLQKSQTYYIINNKKTHTPHSKASTLNPNILRTSIARYLQRR